MPFFGEMRLASGVGVGSGVGEASGAAGADSVPPAVAVASAAAGGGLGGAEDCCEAAFCAWAQADSNAHANSARRGERRNGDPPLECLLRWLATFA